MRMQIDTELKTIKLESQTNLKEFIEKIQNFLPDWADYKLETNVTIQWNTYPVYRNNYWYNPIWGGPCYVGGTISGTAMLSTSNPTLTPLDGSKGLINTTTDTVQFKPSIYNYEA